MTLLDPIRSVETLIYIGYGGDPSSAVRVTRRRRLDRKKQQTERTVYQCFVFGPKESGKSALLNAFIGRYVFTYTHECMFKGILLHVLLRFYSILMKLCLSNRPFPEDYTPTTGDRYAVNVVDQPTVSLLSNEHMPKNKRLCKYAVCIS